MPRPNLLAASPTGNQEEKPANCCISHLFFDAAFTNPHKIALIQASGWAARIRSQSPQPSASSSTSTSTSTSASPCCKPPLYDGDKCFTSAELLSSIDSLTSRLRHIIDDHGYDDPYLIRPPFQDKLYGDGGVQTTSFGPDVHMPKVLAIYMPPSVEYIVSVLSIMRCGEVFLPLDPSWPRDRVLSIISSSNVSLVIACGSSFDKVGCQPLERSHWLVESIICPTLFFSMKERINVDTCSTKFVWPCKKERQRNFCYLMYTSGSTGKPKGVRGTEQGLLNRFLWMQELYPVVGDQQFVFKTSVGFIDHLQEFLGAILNSIPLVIPPISLLKENVVHIIDFLEAYSISRLLAVPSMIKVILPTLQHRGHKKLQSCLKLVVLSGEPFPVSLWDSLHNLLPETCFLNLYGSTEVSGDCTYFDCCSLPKLLKTEKLSSVPIGKPISNCQIVLFGDKPCEGEICVGGLCLSQGYLHSLKESQEYVKLHDNTLCNHANNDCGSQLYYRTGDYGRKLSSGELIFLGRRDRTVKLNGQRVALEEIETTLGLHPEVAEAVVVLNRDERDFASLEAFLVLSKETRFAESIIYSIRNWMRDKVPRVMIPNHFVLVESWPTTSSGKVDFEALERLKCSRTHVQDIIHCNGTNSLLQTIRKAVCDALGVKEVSDNDDFFEIGGDSLSAAHLSHSLGIDMRLVYQFRSPSKLLICLSEKEVNLRDDIYITTRKLDHRTESQNGNEMISGTITNYSRVTSDSTTSRMQFRKNVSPKRLRIDSEMFFSKRMEDQKSWDSEFCKTQCSFSRCNKVQYANLYKNEETHQHKLAVEFPRKPMVSIQELWKVHMESCVDASPLVVLKDSRAYLFIGSHSCKFLCIDAKSGFICWETVLEGRIEGSATIVGDFCQVVVGCYKGKLYFLDFSTGSVYWTFQACGEVKCQPVVDTSSHLIWCGSHDHTLYALDYRSHRCVYKLQCGGSIFASPVIDEGHGSLYVASTSGRVIAVSIKDFPFHTLWLLELEAPIFGSLSITPTSRNVLCCLVDGQVVAICPNGTITWRYRTGGPIFAGPSMSHVLPSQVLVCCRNGIVYSLEPESGRLLWEHNIGDPITASAYIDENLRFESHQMLASDRLVSVCSSLGRVHVLRVRTHLSGDPIKVEEIATLELQADIFSSPVMIGGRIFVGCRDDYVHCLSIESSK